MMPNGKSNNQNRSSYRDNSIRTRRKKVKLVKFIAPLILATLLATVFMTQTGILNIPAANAAESDLVIKRAFYETDSHSNNVIVQSSDLYLNHYQVGFKIPSIESAKPSQITLLYRNVRVVKNYESEFQTFVNNNWILKDSRGNMIRSTYSSSQYIVDKGSSSYQRWVANWIKSYIDRYGYDGVFIDCAVYSTIGEDLWGTTASGAINPRTGRLYTDAEYRQAEISMINTIKDTIGSKLVIGNGIYDGTRFFQRDYDQILLNSKIDGVMSEGWLMTLDNPQWYSESKWKDSVDFEVWLENNFLPKGKIFIPTCQNVESYDQVGTRLPSGCTSEQYALYCFSSVLLGASRSGSTYLNLGSYILRSYPQSLFDIELGTPTGNYYMTTGTHVYTRDYTKTKILVNPTSTTYTVNLDQTYRTPEGQTISGRVTMYPHTGRILERLGTTPAPTPTPTPTPSPSPQPTPTPTPTPNPPPPSSSIIFSDNFEANSFSRWDGQTTTTGESVYITRASWGAPVYDGSYCARFRTDGEYDTARSYVYKNVGSRSTIYARAEINFDTGLALDSWNALWTIQFIDSSGSIIASYGVRADRNSAKWACMYGDETHYATFGPQQDRWYTVEAMFTRSSYGNTVAIYIDGTQAASFSVNTSGENNIAEVRIGIPYNAPGYTSAIYADSVVIDDSYI